MESFQESFDILLKDNFTDDELRLFEGQLDAIAALYVQPILSELSFEDFYPDEAREVQQRDFFKNCQSSISLENLPYFDSNPFQVSYLLELLARFDEILIDTGGVNALMFKDDYLKELKKFRNMDALFKQDVRPLEVKTSAPVTPIDFLVGDIYKEFERLKGIYIPFEELPEKAQKIYLVMSKEKLDSSTLYAKTGLNPKDFDDYLEKLKFFLKKIS